MAAKLKRRAPVLTFTYTSKIIFIANLILDLIGLVYSVITLKTCRVGQKVFKWESYLSYYGMVLGSITICLLIIIIDYTCDNLTPVYNYGSYIQMWKMNMAFMHIYGLVISALSIRHSVCSTKIVVSVLCALSAVLLLVDYAVVARKLISAKKGGSPTSTTFSSRSSLGANNNSRLRER
ncbi:hypothetical protein GJ496_001909 [Pomphorhynchus laevis]|nr:hypothetical protein GJ496_001909 [Pomphorhynchus laevis]